MKKIAVCMMTILLAGCARYEGTLSARLNEKLAAVQELEAQRPAYNHAYYKYYVEPSVGRISTDITSNVFSYNGTQFVMNLNVPGIISDAYYKDAPVVQSGLKLTEEAASAEGNFRDAEGREHPFHTVLYNVDPYIIVLMSTDRLEFYSVCTPGEAPDIAAEMLRTARNVTINEEEVRTAFSNQQVIEYRKKKLELFQYIAPENGVIDELFVDYNTSLGQTYEWNSISGDEINVPAQEETAAPETPEETAEPEAPEETGEPAEDS